MEISSEILDEKKVVFLDGEIDMSNVESIKKEILAIENKDISLDFSKLSYIDSSGIGMLISLHKTSLVNGGSLEIRNVDSKIKNLFEIVGLNRILNII
ncbi:MAG TPA: STAS domain-containing protein [Tepiditoga sp.]|nr:STAS domain-containing protein [Thermotogota bacterium]HOO74232.1 STAS domain-containing protein [Tepiditoga sp.]